MLQPAQKYESELKSLILDTWYDDKYKYFRANTYSSTMTFKDGNYNSHDFASINNDGEVIGYISYDLNRSDGSVYNLIIVNFTDEKLSFGRDLYKALSDIFLRYKFRKLMFCIVVGNPIEKSYDKWISKYGGRIVGTYYKDVMLDDGELYDRKLYEIFREDFLKHIKIN